MEKPKKHYWGVVDKCMTPLFTGTFQQCWNWLMKQHGASTLNQINKAGIRIARIS
jgi:hypothetical protein